MKLFFLFTFCSLMSVFDYSFCFYFIMISLGFLIPLGVDSFFGLFFFDTMSLFFILLGLVVMSICIMSYFYSGSLFFSTGYSFKYMVFMSLLVTISFSVVSLFSFYVLLEMVFLVMFYFLMVFGSKIDRKVSSYYMFFFTVFSSLPLLVFMVFSIGSLVEGSFFSLNFWSSYWGLLIMLMFFVKVPIFGVHMWLPKAHVEAPLVGSIILSGSLLKIGFYGIIRFFKYSSIFFSKCSSYCVSVGWLSALYVSFFCFRQLDIKSLVAYSSVVHMAVTFSSVMSSSFTGLKGCLYECLAHGLSSPLMFYLVYMLYNPLNSRSMIVCKGSGLSSSLFSYILFFVLVSSLGVPPILSFFSEFMCNIGVLAFSQDFFLFTVSLFFLAGVYLFYFYIYFFHGETGVHNTKFIFSCDESLIFFMINFMLLSSFFLGVFF